MREVYKFIVVSCAVLLTACTGQAPQRPSQRKGAAPEADSALIALMELNRRMTEAADEQLLQIGALEQEGEVHPTRCTNAGRGCI